jgi:hypothetical protein
MLVALMYKLVGWTVNVVWVDETHATTRPAAEA